MSNEIVAYFSRAQVLNCNGFLSCLCNFYVFCKLYHSILSRFYKTVLLLLIYSCFKMAIQSPNLNTIQLLQQRDSKPEISCFKLLDGGGRQFPKKIWITWSWAWKDVVELCRTTIYAWERDIPSYIFFSNFFSCFIIIPDVLQILPPRVSRKI